MDTKLEEDPLFRGGVRAAACLLTAVGLTMAGPGLGVTGVAEAGEEGLIEPERVVLSALDTAPLLAQDAVRLLTDPTGPALRSGVVRSFDRVRAPARFAGSTRVRVEEDGTHVWATQVESDGAAALRVWISRCDLPPGATVSCRDADDPTEIYGPWRARGPHGTGRFYTPQVFADRVHVEVRVPAQVADRRVRFQVSGVAHIYLEDPASRFSHLPSPPKMTSCTVAVACEPAHAAGPARAIGRMTFVKGGQVFLCSGSLLVDSDPASQVPWFLTANHCIGNEAEANSLDVVWDYRASTCTGAPPAISGLPRTSGATLVATDAAIDVSLLRLTGDVPSGRQYLGWTDVPPGNIQVTNVSHPQGDAAHFARGNIVSSTNPYHSVTWFQGGIEGGSSGSPLLNGSFKVIGVASRAPLGGCSTGANNLYSRMDLMFPKLRSFLVDFRAEEEKPNLPPPPPPGPRPPPEPFGFFFGHWNKAFLNGGETQVWTAFLYTPTNPTRALKLKARIKGRKGIRAVLVDPTGATIDITKRRTKIRSPPQGEWRIELHAPEGAKPKVSKIKLSPNF